MPECPYCNFYDPVDTNLISQHVVLRHLDSNAELIESTNLKSNSQVINISSENLTITVNYGPISDDSTLITADDLYRKYIKVLVVKEEPTLTSPNPSLGVLCVERFEGEDYPTIDSFLVSNLGEYYVYANGTSLVRV